LHAESRALSADYPGYLYQALKREYPGLSAGFTLGAAGNQSSRHFRTAQSFDEARRVGEAIAAEAARVLAKSPKCADPVLSVAAHDFTPPLFSLPSLDDAVAGEAEARRNYEDAKAAGQPYPLVRTLECTLIGAEHLLEFARSGLRDDRVAAWASPFELQIMGFGDGRLVFCPCEIFVEYGLRLKKESPYPMTFLVSCANGSACGYVCTPEAHREGGYEALWTRYRPETGDLLVDAALEHLRGGSESKSEKE
jgi:hypothetical protein